MSEKFTQWIFTLALVYLFVHMGVFLLRMNGIEVGGTHYGK
jgi:UPF0716 family protein affecting phage T7 exclusion